MNVQATNIAIFNMHVSYKKYKLKHIDGKS
jgi:hypothetical protein